MSCYDRDGKFLWGVPRPQEQGTKDIKADGVVGDLNIPGLGHVLGTWSWHGITGLTWSPPTACWDESFRYYYQAHIDFMLVANGAGHQPKVYVDDAEFVEAPTNMAAQPAEKGTPGNAGVPACPVARARRGAYLLTQ